MGSRHGGGDQKKHNRKDHRGQISPHQVAFAESYRPGRQPHADVSDVGQREQTVARKRHCQNNGGWHHENTDRDTGRVGNGQGRVDADVELVALKTFIEHFLDAVRKRQQAFHQNLHHLGGDHHCGGGGHSHNQALIDRFACQNGNQQSDYRADRHGLAQHAEAFLNALRVRVQAVQTGNPVVNLV